MADDLLKLMQQWATYLDEQSRNAPGGKPFPWPPADKDGSASVPQAELVALLTQQSVEFARFAEQIIELLEQQGRQTELSTVINHFQDHLRRLTQEWILSRWQLPEQLGALFRTHSFQDDLLLDNPFIHGMKSLLNTPDQLGLQHSLQQQLKNGVDLLIDYEQALRQYSAHYSEINSAATREFLQQIEIADPAIDSLGQLHDLWVESYEQCYGKTIVSLEYREAHGRISNAVMRLRLFLQQLRNAQLQQLGIPNEDQLSQIHQQLHEQRRTIKSLKRELSALSELRAEVAALKREIADNHDAKDGRKGGPA
ncbi:poly(R)-hydroxyalkanoic acid synthase subunit PhaE [Marinobacterium mangrovicola]|uniref:Poly(3-hydroxyalkanoate) polymerase subunit PhaE n=1 Tax=Marinobacterium mangrovicola TaxID=1476959 RepID=A0A4V2PEJ9_9GAMM|nr:poly(R)-hydroxyalkanoic acid synthase subunit PhaE [Marinobacterium mangrovicola]TCK09446.1 class III poly(R)-hydroxyalkanoic acid synthase PhaE subunit [Marinobacterium mangrovicola]